MPTGGAGRGLSVYDACSFDRIKFASIAPGNARFVNCTFRQARISEFCGTRIELIGCTFTGRLGRGYQNATRERKWWRPFDRRRNTIVNNDFSQCEIRDFSFRSGVDLEKQALPQGERYLYLRQPAPVIRAARLAISTWEDESLRRLANINLDVWQDELAGGQVQLFACIQKKGELAKAYEKTMPVIVPGSA